MSENKKTENAIPEIKDEALDAVTGGSKWPKQIHTKKCATDGCIRVLPLHSSAIYCDKCIEKMREQGQNTGS